MRCLWGLLLLLLSARAQAQAPTALSWVRDAGADSCIGATELGARVERLVGPVLVPAPSGEVSVEGHIARHPSGNTARYVATITISDARGAQLGQRIIQGQEAAPGVEPDCRTLDDQLAFVIAVAIDPNAALAEIPGELEPEGDPGAELLADLKANPPQPAELPKPAAKKEEPASLLPEGDAGPRFHAALAAGYFAGTGMLPSASSGPSFELGAGLGIFMQRARLSLALPQTKRAEIAEVDLGWLELGTSTCATLELTAAPALRLDLCAGITFAHFTAEPRGFPGNDQGEWLIGPRADARLAWLFVPPFALVLDLSLSSVWPKHRVIYESAGRSRQVHEVPEVSATGSLLVELRL